VILLTIIDKLNEIESKRRRDDALAIFEITKRLLPDEPKLWDDKAVGFGDYHYVNKTNEGDMPILGFVPAKAHITMYFTVGGLDPYKHLLEKIGPYKRGKICLYVTNLNKMNLDVFEELIKTYYQDVLDGNAIYS
jgi:hypothetical protein